MNQIKFGVGVRATMKCGVVVAAVILVAWSVIELPASAYEEGGHFYTISDTWSVVPPSWDATGIVPFCAQLPDETTELDAAQLWKAVWWDWDSWYSMLSDNRIKYMVTVQQFQHGLTGGSSKVVREVAKTIMVHFRDLAATTKDRNDLCAFGLALHLVGDSYAHTDLSDPNSMYPTGWGHAGDMYRPDRPMYSQQREQLWTQYVSFLMTEVWQAQPNPELTKLEAQAGALVNAPRMNSFISGWGESQFRQLLIDGRKSLDPKGLPALTQTVETHSNSPCEGYVQTNFGESPGFTCAEAWQRYREFASPLFQYTAGAIKMDPSAPPGARYDYATEAPHSL